MKPKSFLLFLLLLPYLIWVMGAIFSLILIWPLIYTVGLLFALVTEVIPVLSVLGKFFGAMYFFILIYVFGIVFWGVPYTLFSIVFLFWSKNKSTKKIYASLFYSPLLLAFIVSVGLMMLGLISRSAFGRILSLEDWKNLGLLALLGATLFLIYGYAFVGIGMAGYKYFDSRKLFKSETDSSGDIHTEISPVNQ